ncbi:N4-gp56 family major capsid protein [Candidatus Bathyarchaeota archaeon]|nr:N4-gp56 family major capsid protein [Candidatus Bathyarchaeota archaeon]
MIEFLRKLFATLRSERGETLTNMTYVAAGSGVLDYAIPEWWSERLRDDAIRRAFWGARFEGKEGSRKPIIVNEDFTKKPGDVIHFNVVSQVFTPGVTGETTLAGKEGKLALGQYNLTVDWIRNAMAYTKALEKRVNFNIAQTIRAELSDWMARHIDSAMFKAIIDGATNTIYAGDATSVASLGANDHFGTEEIDRIKLALSRTAIPIRVEGQNGEEEEYYGAVISEIDEYWLKGDSVWSQAQRDAGPRDYAKNRIFTGALGMYNGVIIYVHKAKKSARNIQGSPLRPEARLYADITTASTEVAFDVSTTSKDLGDFFSGSTSVVVGAGTITVDSEEITYTSITVGTGVTGSTYRFAGCTRGCNGTTAAAHTAGALITQRNVASVIGFGAEVAVRGWGMKPVPITQGYDYKFPDGSSFENGLGIAAVFGQAIVADSAGDAPNFILMKTHTDVITF